MNNKNKIKLNILTLIYFCKEISLRAVTLLGNDSRRTGEILKELINEKYVKRRKVQSIDYKKIEVIRASNRKTNKFFTDWDYNGENNRMFRPENYDKETKENLFKHIVLSEFLALMINLNIKIHNVNKKITETVVITSKFLKGYISNDGKLDIGINRSKDGKIEPAKLFISNDYKNSSAIAYIIKTYNDDSKTCNLCSVFYLRKNEKIFKLNQEHNIRNIQQLDKIENSIFPKVLQNSNIILLTALHGHNNFLYDFLKKHDELKNKRNPYTKKTEYNKTNINIETLKDKTFIIPRNNKNIMTTMLDYTLKGYLYNTFEIDELEIQFNHSSTRYGERTMYGVFYNRDDSVMTFFVPVIELISLREFMYELDSCYVKKLVFYTYEGNFDLLYGFYNYLYEKDFISEKVETRFKCIDETFKTKDYDYF